MCCRCQLRSTRGWNSLRCGNQLAITPCCCHNPLTCPNIVACRVIWTTAIETTESSLYTRASALSIFAVECWFLSHLHHRGCGAHREFRSKFVPAGLTRSGLDTSTALPDTAVQAL